MTSTIGARTDAEFSPERPIEIGDVPEAAVERDVEHSSRPGGEPHGGFTQACARRPVLRAARQRALQFDRNFCQDAISRCAI